MAFESHAFFDCSAVWLFVWLFGVIALLASSVVDVDVSMRTFLLYSRAADGIFDRNVATCMLRSILVA